MNKRFTYWFESPGYLNPSESFVIQTLEWVEWGRRGKRQESPGRKQLCSNLKGKKKSFMLQFWPECAFFPHKEPRYDFFLIFYRFKLIFDIQDCDWVQATEKSCWGRSESPWRVHGKYKASLLRSSSECQRITQLDYIPFSNEIGKFLSSFPNAKSSSSSSLNMKFTFCCRGWWPRS